MFRPVQVRDLADHMYQARFWPSLYRSLYDKAPGGGYDKSIAKLMRMESPELYDLIQTGKELELQKATLLYTLIQTVQDADNSPQQTISKMENEAIEDIGMQVWGGEELVATKRRILAERAGTIEVNKNGTVFRVHFPIPEICLRVGAMDYFKVPSSLYIPCTYIWM